MESRGVRPAQAPAINQAGETRSIRVESLRALAALGVVLGHCYLVARGNDFSTFSSRVGLSGGYGVWLFFALSGYLLYLPFARRDFGTAGDVDYGRYATNRILRILPLYYFALVLFMAVNEGGGTMSQWLHFATFTESFSGSTVGTVDGPMWSVVVEIQFYALLPLLALGIGRLSRGSAGRAAVMLLALGAVSFGFWWLKVHTAHAPLDRRFEYSLPATFMNFVPGLLLALVQSRADRLRLPPAWPLALASLGLFVAAVASIAWAQVLCAPAAALLIAAVVLPTSRPSIALNRALDLRILGLIGIASYSLYIWHFPIVLSLGAHTALGLVPLTLVSLAICVTVAGASYVVVERPGLRLRSRWWSSSRGTQPAPGVEPAPSVGTAVSEAPASGG